MSEFVFDAPQHTMRPCKKHGFTDHIISFNCCKCTTEDFQKATERTNHNTRPAPEVGFEEWFEKEFSEGCEAREIQFLEKWLKDSWQAAQAAMPSTLRRDLEMLEKANILSGYTKCHECNLFISGSCISSRAKTWLRYIDKIEQLLTKLREGK